MTSNKDKPISRRKIIGFGALGVLVAGGIGGFELVDHNVLPGKQTLDQIDGACDVNVPNMGFFPVGQSTNGSFYSHFRNRNVGYEIGYPPGYKEGENIPLVVMLHGFGGNHTDALYSMTPAQAVALKVDGKPLFKMALVTVDGGGGYWNPHPGDDPMSMVIYELIPMCNKLGLGVTPHSIATMGISMGGFGALMFAEHFTNIVGASAAISPAIWQSYSEAKNANAGAYANEAAFEKYNLFADVGNLKAASVRIGAGVSDPFFPDVQKFSQLLPASAVIDFSNGCHTGPFFTSQEPASLQFLSEYFAAHS